MNTTDGLLLRAFIALALNSPRQDTEKLRKFWKNSFEKNISKFRISCMIVSPFTSIIYFLS